ncbi:hypothetical protein ACTA71_006056 [Dictyostelium dimigraforme]
MITSFEDFNKLNDKEISEIVMKTLSNNNTIVYAFNGPSLPNFTEFDQNPKNSMNKLLNDLVMMCNHGIKTICYPMWNGELKDKESFHHSKFINYLEGLSVLLENESMVKMYNENGIRIIFYGDYELLLKHGNNDVQNQNLLNTFEMIMEQTKNNINHTILIGTNIEEPSKTIIKNIISYYNSNGNINPTPQDLIKQYYGVNIDPVTLYIGSNRFTTIGRPILISDKGNEDLYFPISPHQYFSKLGFRKVLFDKLFCRSNTNAKEYILKIIDIILMKNFYSSNSDNVVGFGNVDPKGKFWYPDSQVNLPSTNDN